MPTPSKLTVDFTQVEDRREGGKAAHVPEGDYLLRVMGCEKKAKKDDATAFYLSWKLQIATPEKYATAGFVYHNTSLREASLWALRNFLEDLGIAVPKKTVEIPIAAIIAKHMVIGATLADGEPYNNKVKSEIQATFKKEQYQATGEETEVEAETEAAAATEDEDLEELDVDDL